MRNTISKAMIAGLAALSLRDPLSPRVNRLRRPWHGSFHGGARRRFPRRWLPWRRLAWRWLAWRWLAWRRLAWRRLGGPAVVGGLAAGALLAAPYAYGGYGYGGCTSYAPIYDAYGNYLGQQLVNGC